MPEIKLVYGGLEAVYLDGMCIGVIVASREWQQPHKRVFFCYEDSNLYYGLTSQEAVSAYLQLSFENG